MEELSARAQGAWRYIWQNRRLIDDGGRKLIVYAEGLAFDAWGVKEIQELVSGGYVGREQIGQRKVLVLGSWEAKEKRFSNQDGGGLDAIYHKKMERYSLDQQRMIDLAFQEFEASRSRGGLSLRSKIQFLVSCEQYQTAIVVEGLMRFFARKSERPNDDLAERYALGIIRSLYREEHKQRVVDTRAAKIRDRQSRVEKIAFDEAERQSQEKRRMEAKIVDVLARSGLTVTSASTEQLRQAAAMVQLG
jgi:hypothetical protein